MNRIDKIMDNIEKGLCGVCGKPNPLNKPGAAVRKITCPSCSEKERRQ